MQKQLVAPSQVSTFLIRKLPITNMYVTPNFKWEEVLHKQTEVPTITVLNNLRSCCVLMEYYRKYLFNNSPIQITSGWRSQTYNEALRKCGYNPAKYSEHLFGRALDFVVYGYTSQQVYDLLDPVHFGGLEKDAKLDNMDWTHMDIRGRNIRLLNSTWKTLPCKYDVKAHKELFSKAA